MDLGLTCVIATQLWHHTFLGGGLCELPVWEPTPIREGERPAIDLGVSPPQPSDPALRGERGILVIPRESEKDRDPPGIDETCNVNEGLASSPGQRLDQGSDLPVTPSRPGAMRRFPVRFRMRTMMVLVALAGVACLLGREYWAWWLRRDDSIPVRPSRLHVVSAGGPNGLTWAPGRPIPVAITYDFKFGTPKPAPGTECLLLAEVWFEDVETGRFVDGYTFDAPLTVGGRETADGSLTWEAVLPRPGQYQLRHVLNFVGPAGERRMINGGVRIRSWRPRRRVGPRATQDRNHEFSKLPPSKGDDLRGGPRDDGRRILGRLPLRISGRAERQGAAAPGPGRRETDTGQPELIRLERHVVRHQRPPGCREARPGGATAESDRCGLLCGQGADREDAPTRARSPSGEFAPMTAPSSFSPRLPVTPDPSAAKMKSFVRDR